MFLLYMPAVNFYESFVMHIVYMMQLQLFLNQMAKFLQNTFGD